MRALTIRRPWTDAILSGNKDWENRSWPIPDKFLGQVIALHAGKKYENKSAEMMERGYQPPKKEDSPTGIIGLIMFDRFVSVTWPTDTPWLFGPFGWHIRGVAPLETPIPCKGALGFWRVPEDVEAKILEQDYILKGIYNNLLVKQER